ncbi:keratin-associated protein 10-7-like isoform X1 [Homalodisca vitripennis]|uniref:keratin-associated protein 10-7-like isoform X1 n=1 Tax=Homalodisca vitripennis TaxID=197043 RepID=UPI001EE9D24E|nr:keratin-associated protein 10-7-like isoform X1 [Homalodisca vitripennis]
MLILFVLLCLVAAIRGQGNSVFIPQCANNDHCPLDHACVAQRCEDPCLGTCGSNSTCHVRFHIPSCACPSGFTGDPLTACFPQVQPQCTANDHCPLDRTCVGQRCEDPCVGTCGSNSTCNVRFHIPTCVCPSGYTGDPLTACFPQVQPQCTANDHCPLDRACVGQRCEDPCVGACGFNSICQVRFHIPSCACPSGYTGDPFTACLPQDPPESCTPPTRKVYRVHSAQKINWYSAVLHCLSIGERLASITSKEEMNLIKEEISRTGIRNDQFWTSGNSFVLGKWTWFSTGLPITFVDWGAGEPNNINNNEKCVQYHERNRTGYVWNDVTCVGLSYPICEHFEK